MNGYVVALIGIAVLIVLQGFFVAAEISLVSARRSALQAAAENGSRGARSAIALLDDPSRLLSTISAAITLIGFSASAAAAVTFQDPVTTWLVSLGIPGLRGLAGGIAVFLVTMAITYVTLVFGELVPKRLGLQRAERIAAALATPIEWLSIAMSPVVWILSRSTDAVSPLFGNQQGGKPGVSEEEIKLLVTEQGTLLDEEKRMIHEVLDLGDTMVREIMVPRVDTTMAADTLTVREALPLFQESGFSRMPVFHDDPDSIVGVVLLKDLVGSLAQNDARDPVTDFLRKPLFVPETKPILALLSEMRASHSHMAVVVDEHGGTAGIVTIEDIVEEIVGEITDEFDAEHRYIAATGPDTWVVDGRLSAEEAHEQLGLPVPDSEEFETIAGWVLLHLGHIPVAGETIELPGVTVSVLSVRDRRVARLQVTRSAASVPDDQ